jgi:two-component system, NtrC family, response regulator AtoC
VRGAFTGAVRDNPGYFRLAHGGTLFLDEVAELPLEMQAKLLRVLQERVVVPVGGGQALPVDVRIVAATHRSLRSAVRANKFRADLLYRLRVIPLFLPPLRERLVDIEPLTWRFITELQSDAGRTISRLSSGALRALQAYRWPGNVRELRNVVEYALVMGEGPLLTEADFPSEVLMDTSEAPLPAVNQSRLDDGGHTTEIGAHGEPPTQPPELRKLLTALERAAGHHGRAAQSLGMSRVTLWRKLRKWGLVPEGEPGER